MMSSDALHKDDARLRQIRSNYNMPFGWRPGCDLEWGLAAVATSERY